MRKRDLVTIEEDVSDVTAISENWLKRGSLYATVHEVRGGEVFRGIQLESEVAMLVEVNYHDWITPKMRLKHRGETLNIDAVIDRNQRRRDLELHCSRVADDG